MVDLELFRVLAQQMRAQVHVPYHPLRDDERENSSAFHEAASTFYWSYGVAWRGCIAT